jgi:hypothetical protein
VNEPSPLGELHVELSRHRVRPGQSAEVDRWMQSLRDRREECLATLSRDGLAIEVIFRTREQDADVLYWFEIGSRPGDLSMVADELLTPIDRDALEYGRRAKEPGHTSLEVELVLMPEPVARAVRAWLERVG